MKVAGSTIKPYINGKSYGAARLVGEIEAVNYTPIMPGDFTGKTRIRLTTGQQATVWDLSKQIIGRERWLLRTILIALGEAQTHREAEKWPSSREPGLVPWMYGTVKPKPWKAVYTIRARPLVSNPQPDPNFIDPKGMRSMETLTRYRLLTMKKSREDRLRLAPLPPGSVRLKIEILARHTDNPHYRLEATDRLVTLLTLAVLEILGLGKASNRGFGRFKPSTNSWKGSLRALEPEGWPLEECENSGSSGCGNLVYKVFQEIASAIYGAVGMGSPGRRPDIIVRTYRIGTSPRNLTRSLERIRRDRTVTSKHDVHRALEIIAGVTLKQSWKAYKNKHRRGGGAFHTWTLGLPRHGKQGKQSLIHCYTSQDSPRPVTGYLLESETPSKATAYCAPPPRINMRGQSVECKESHPTPNTSPSQPKTTECKHLYIIGPRGEGDSGEKIKPKNMNCSRRIAWEEGRRQSPIILYPLDRKGQTITLILFPHHDLQDLYPKLLHSGGLVNWDNRRPEFIDAVRIAKIQQIIEQGTPTVIVLCNHKHYANKHVKGIETPTNNIHSNTNDPLQTIIQTTLKFIDTLLK